MEYGYFYSDMKFILPFLILFYATTQAQVSLNVDSVSRWLDIKLPRDDASHNQYNEVWGFVHNSKEYGVIGSKAGAYIVDLSNPLFPLGKIVATPGAIEALEDAFFYIRAL
jgi:hypothetical protein